MMISNQVDVPAAARLPRRLMIAVAIFDAMISIAINISKRIFCNTLFGSYGLMGESDKGADLRALRGAASDLLCGFRSRPAPGAAVAAVASAQKYF
jgi:hypothetical protein